MLPPPSKTLKLVEEQDEYDALDDLPSPADPVTGLKPSGYEIRCSLANMEAATNGYKDLDLCSIAMILEAIMAIYPLPAYAGQSLCRMRMFALMFQGGRSDLMLGEPTEGEDKTAWMDRRAMLMGILITRIATILFTIVEPLRYKPEHPRAEKFVHFLRSYAFHHVNVYNTKTREYVRERILDAGYIS
jgi:hypothetical protein